MLSPDNTDFTFAFSGGTIIQFLSVKTNHVTGIYLLRLPSSSPTSVLRFIGLPTIISVSPDSVVIVSQENVLKQRIELISSTRECDWYISGVPPRPPGSASWICWAEHLVWWYDNVVFLMLNCSPVYFYSLLLLYPSFFCLSCILLTFK